MIIRGSVAVAVIVVFSLAGCASPPLPEGPSARELDARVAAELDRQWQLTGLDGVVDRPVVPASEPTESFDNRRFECMADNGLPGWGTDDGGLTMDGREPTTDEQLTYYGCLALYPTVEMLSVDQLDYIYDYYARFLVPCLGSEGYPVDPVTRRAFVTATVDYGWRWSPYRALTTYPTTQERLDALMAKCPAALPGIPGWENKPY